MILKAAGLRDGAAATRIRDQFAQFGVDPSRIETLGSIPDAREHFAAYNRIDIALDTFPYHGTTTTCEALWMGVPVISLAGQVHVSRVGVSLLSAVGLTRLIAATPDEYVRIAAELLQNVQGLSELRLSLRERMRGSPLMDAATFTRDLENLYRQMWRRVVA
jgi:predicted O-linked N-acetylglucosamine transferase (SPINDLY family)